MCSSWRNIILSSIVVLMTACYQSPPPEIEPGVIQGDFAFSGYQWRYKDASSPVGPGPNLFSGTTDFAWVDANGHLHLKIAKKNNQWNCSEVISTKVFGYGTYTMTCVSDISDFNEKVVFGFFTWDSYSFQTQANSEVDIEFSRWNNANDTNLISYAVQPVIFSNPVPYTERTERGVVNTALLKKPMTHMFRWTPDSVLWESYEGTTAGINKVAEWIFTKNNITRRKIEGNRTSDPIVLPAPSDSTNVRFNLWLLDGAAPSNQQEHEIIISNFTYKPL